MSFEGGKDRMAAEESEWLELGLPPDLYNLPKGEQITVVEKKIKAMEDKLADIDPSDSMANTKKNWYTGIKKSLEEIRDEVKRKMRNK